MPAQANGQLPGSVGKKAPATPKDVSHIVDSGDQEGTANTNSKGSTDSLNVTSATSSSPKKASDLSVARSHF
jgi:hypothetical protein